MSEAVVAQRYAEALFQLGTEKANLDQLAEELRVVRDVFVNNDEFFTFLRHPRITNEKKKQLLEEAFQSLQVDVLHTLKLLVDRQRVNITPSIIDHFIDKVNDVKGIAEASVTSVRELTENEKEELKQGLAKSFDKKTIQLKTAVDPSILGGLRIRIGNTIHDGTIKGKLARLERKLVSAN